MAFSMSDVKKLCKEKNYGFRAGSLFGITKNDSGKCDFVVETADKSYAVKVLTVGEDAKRVYFYNVGGYISVKGAAVTDYMWVAPKFSDKAVPVLLLSEEVAATEISKNAATTVTTGATVFGCKVYTPAAFAELLG